MMEPIDPTSEAILARARDVARATLAPNANAVDESTFVPRDNLQALAAAGLLGLRVPQQYGGSGALPRVIRRYHGILASACGTTTFVAIQHSSACRLINLAPSDALKHRLLPEMATGELLGAPAFSHLRKPGAPVLRVTEEEGDFVFDGIAPWVSGWGAIKVIALGGTLPDGKHLYAALLPSETRGVEAWPPMKLAAMNASSTVSITLSRARVPRENLLMMQSPEEAAVSDAANVLNQAPCSLGAAAAAEKLLWARIAEDPSVTPFVSTLRGEIESAWNDLETWADRPDDPAFAANALEVRARCVDLGVRAAFSAIVATGGTALKRDKDAQRIYREAMIYAVAPQTAALRKATLNRLLPAK